MQVLARGNRGSAFKAADDEALGYFRHGKGYARRRSGGARGGDARHHPPGNAVRVEQGGLLTQRAVKRGVARVDARHGFALKGGGAHERVALLKR